MTPTSTITLITFLGTILGLICFQSRPAYVFASAIIVLYATGVVSSRQLVDSAANIGLLTLILLMVCSIALEKTRLLRLIARKVIKSGYTNTWLRLFTMTTISSALLNNSAVVSTMLAPLRNNPYHPAGKLLLPLSYTAIFGGTLTLVGTSTNLIVNSLVVDAGLPSLNFFDFTMIGSAICISCGVTLYVFSNRLPSSNTEKQQVKQYLIDAKIKPDSKLIGKSIEKNGLRHLESLFLVEILRNQRLISPVNPTEVIQASDRLIFSGDITKVMQLNQFDGLSLFAYENGLPISNLTEVIIRHDSVLIGMSLKDTGFRALFDAAVVAIKRDGDRVSGKLGDVILRAGDYLVLAVGDDFVSRKNITKNFVIISGVEPETSLSGSRELFTIVGFFSAIALSAFGLVSLFKSLLILLSLLIIFNCLNVSEIIRRLPKTIWTIIASALLISKALTNCGILNQFTIWLQSNVHSLSPFIALICVYLLTWWLTELVTNNAAAALIFPIALSIANSVDIDPKIFIFAVAYGASASFISPYGYQTNLMVFNAGHYCLKDFFRIGLPVSIMYGVTVISMLYIIYF